MECAGCRQRAVSARKLHRATWIVHCAVCFLHISAGSVLGWDWGGVGGEGGRAARSEVQWGVELFEICLVAQLFCCKGSLIKDQHWVGPVCLGSSAKVVALSIGGQCYPLLFWDVFMVSCVMLELCVNKSQTFAFLLCYCCITKNRNCFHLTVSNQS